MMQNFTPFDLLQFIYKETTKNETQEIKESLKFNFFLREDYQELYEPYKTLPKAKFLPSKMTIQNILDYSRFSTIAPQC